MKIGAKVKRNGGEYEYLGNRYVAGFAVPVYRRISDGQQIDEVELMFEESLDEEE